MNKISFNKKNNSRPFFYWFWYRSSRGSLNQVIKNGMNKDVGLLVNSSREYYASVMSLFKNALMRAKKIQIQMAEFL